jgi:drug/metabolite transporter (DMT)-like permease
MSGAESSRKMEHSLPALWCLAAAVLFGVSTPIAKVLLDDIGPFSLSGLLYIGAAVAVLPSARPISALGRGVRADRLRLSGVVVFGGMLAPVLLFLGLGTASANTVSLWLNLETALTAVLAAAFFREHIGRAGWGAVAVVCAGSLLLVWPLSPGSAAAALLVGLACGCWAIDNNLTALIDGSRRHKPLS